MNEFLNVTLAPLAELVQQALRGQLPDVKTQAAVLRAWTMLRPEAPDPGVGAEAL